MCALQLITHAGRLCPDGVTLASLGMLPGGRYAMDVCVRLRGGGGDGGSTGAESRASYLEMYATKKPDKVRKDGPAIPCLGCHAPGSLVSPCGAALRLSCLVGVGVYSAGVVSCMVPPGGGSAGQVDDLPA